MEIGKFNQKIIIQKKTIISDNIGNQTEKWINFHECWAEVNGVYGREYWQARQANEEKTINFKIRCCKKIEYLNSTDFRIFFRNANYDIQVVNNEFFGDKFLRIKAISEYDRRSENE